ncbi:MAG: hypothetical protein RLZZ519_1800 [Bacteroidota bacterium]
MSSHQDKYFTFRLWHFPSTFEYLPHEEVSGEGFCVVRGTFLLKPPLNFRSDRGPSSTYSNLLLRFSGSELFQMAHACRLH